MKRKKTLIIVFISHFERTKYNIPETTTIFAEYINNTLCLVVLIWTIIKTLSPHLISIKRQTQNLVPFYNKMSGNYNVCILKQQQDKRKTSNSCNLLEQVNTIPPLYITSTIEINAKPLILVLFMSLKTFWKICLSYCRVVLLECKTQKNWCTVTVAPTIEHHGRHSRSPANQRWDQVPGRSQRLLTC